MKTSLLSLIAATATACAATAQAAPNTAYAPLPYQPMGMHGQGLVDMEAFKHPELKILTVHVTPPGIGADVDDERRLMFSNIGRIGKLDTDSTTDADVYRSGKELVEVLTDAAPASTNFSITATPKYEVLVPLNDVSGKKVGLVVMVFPYNGKDFDHEKYHAIAKSVVSELSSRTTSKDDLFKPAVH